MEGNIGLQFYRGYYQDYFGQHGVTKCSEKDQQEKAKKKNSEFADFKDTSYQKNIRIDTEYSFPLKTVYPGLYTGSGYSFGAGLKGEFQLGFLFDHATGLPYISGSSVKGTVRSVFPNGGEGKLPERNPKDKKERTNYIWDIVSKFIKTNDSSGQKSEDIVSEIELEIFEGRDIRKELEEKKNKSNAPESYLSIYKRDIFHDVYIAEPVKQGKTNGSFLGTDYITPHKIATENPTPLPFLKILPGVTVRFQFVLHDGYYLKAQNKLELFKQILLDFGIGAKTNVGYGQFRK
jgi:CRISPR-associated protein Cmr6